MMIRMSAPPTMEGSCNEFESRLCRQARGGSDTAFVDLVWPYVGSLRRMALMRLRSFQDAEDVVQESLYRAYSRLAQFRGEARFATWLYAIARNEIRQRLRFRAAAWLLSIDDPNAGAKEMLEGGRTLEYEQSEVLRRLHRAIAELPQKYRTMVELCDLGGYSVAEAAQSLSLTVSAAKSRRYRARLMLAQALKDWRTRRVVPIRPAAYPALRAAAPTLAPARRSLAG